MSKPLASLSLDLDNQWSYMKTHGDPGWESFPSYLEVLVPRVLGFLADRGLRITFFVVGQDAALPRNHAALACLATAGHEIGNHSFHHEPWLHLYSPAQIEQEIELAENAILLATGVRPRGFRGPGFSCSEATLKVLAARGYRYDASTFPTFLGPLARAYYFLQSTLDSKQLEQRKQLFGRFSEGFRPLRPFTLNLDEGSLVEVPVTTMPILKIPIHLSYVIYLASFSRGLAVRYFQTAMELCRITSTPPSLLLHPLDFLGRDDIDNLRFFPGMNLDSRFKLDLVSDVLSVFTRHFKPVPLQEQVESFSARTMQRAAVAS
ncbi:MAG TPA: polysaccharide deacetylase family protein [Bryobacteraceae bacterium]|nr:polysaccharide deacetylase family protein [Bryobacteraceae bacterium]